MVNHAAHLLSDFGGARLLSQTVTEEGSWSPLSTTSFSPHSMTPWFARLTTRSAKRNCFCSGPSELPVLGFCPCVSVRWISSPSLDSVRFLPPHKGHGPWPIPGLRICDQTPQNPSGTPLGLRAKRAFCRIPAGMRRAASGALRTSPANPPDL